MPLRERTRAKKDPCPLFLGENTDYPFSEIRLI